MRRFLGKSLKKLLKEANENLVGTEKVIKKITKKRRKL